MPIYPESNKEEFVKIGEIIKDRWKLKQKVGSGGFGTIFSAEDSLTGMEVAVKTEMTSDGSRAVLRMEVAVLRRLKGKPHACSFYAAGRTKTYNFLVMSLCGRNLAELRRSAVGQKFSVSCSLRIVRQMLAGIKNVHETGFIHRDVKPSNFAMGRNSLKRMIHILDFGLARQYLISGAFRQARANSGFRGTVRYASLATHRSEEMGPQDDLWSLLYVIVEFLTSVLPWRGIKNKDDVMVSKQENTYRPLVKLTPEEVHQCLLGFGKLLEPLKYGDKPNYAAIDKRLKDTIFHLGYKDDDPFDWEAGARADQERSDKLSNTQPYRAGSKSRRKENATDAPEDVREEMFPEGGMLLEEDIKSNITQSNSHTKSSSSNYKK